MVSWAISLTQPLRTNNPNMTITTLTSKTARLSMLDPDIEQNATRLLTNERTAFNVVFHDISEFEFSSGKRNSSINLELRTDGSTRPIAKGRFLYHGPEPSSANHLHINRYISSSDRNIHFITVWSDRARDYCEFFIHNYGAKTSERFIP